MLPNTAYHIGLPADARCAHAVRAGAGLIGQAFAFPVILLDNATTANAQQRAAYNADQVGRRTLGARILSAWCFALSSPAQWCPLVPLATQPAKMSPLLQGMNADLALNFARMTLTMEANGNSSACLAAQTCLPLGGHSVLATLPPLPPPANDSSVPAGAASAGAAGAAAVDLPALWVLAQVDTAALFHEAAEGADAPVSGLIAMLAAAEVLGSSNASAAMAAAGARYQRRLVFAALAGEPWGLMGSKRLLWELSTAPSNSSLSGLGAANGSLAGVRNHGRWLPLWLPLTTLVRLGALLPCESCSAAACLPRSAWPFLC